MQHMREVVHGNGVRTLRFGLDGANLVAAVTTRAGGRSSGPYDSLNVGYHVEDDPACVTANRGLVCEALEVERLTVADQQHGPNVAVIGEALDGAGHASLADSKARLGNIDALVTDRPGAALMIMVADCAPVVLYDADHHSLGVAHVGRGGAVLDVVGATVAAMSAQFGSDPEALRAGIGPCIGADSYELGEPQLSDTRAVFGEALFTPTAADRACFDLMAAVRRRLRDAGVREESIEGPSTATSTAPDLLFSDRAVRPCGRFGLIAALR